MTVVADASVLVTFLTQGPKARAIRERIAGEDFLHAPHLIDVEVLQVFRRLIRTRTIDMSRARLGLDSLATLRLVRHEHATLRERIWSLRNNFTAYDASYIALAESLDATLLTSDRALGKQNVHHARVEVFP